MRIAESGTMTMPDVVWNRTKSASAAIAPLAAQSIVRTVAVDAVAASLGISRRQVSRSRDGAKAVPDPAEADRGGGAP